jgi:hypothetical protein
MRRREYVNKIFKGTVDTFKIINELQRKESKDGNRSYRTFEVECIECGTRKVVLINSINTCSVGCTYCRSVDAKNGIKRVGVTKGTKAIPKKTFTASDKIAIKKEIDARFDYMKDMARNDELNKYLSEKFDIQLPGDAYQEEEYNNPEDEYNFDNEIDWDSEMNKYLDNDEE